jgi:hypothetical protein
MKALSSLSYTSVEPCIDLSIRIFSRTFVCRGNVSKRAFRVAARLRFLFFSLFFQEIAAPPRMSAAALL